MNINRRKLLTSAIAMTSASAVPASGASSGTPDFAAVRADFPRARASAYFAMPHAIR